MSDSDNSLLVNILVVDDIPDYAEIIETILNKKGFKCKITSVVNSDETIAILEEEKKFPIIILDYALKGSELSGIDLIDKIKELAPESIIIFSTGVGSEEVAVEALQKGAYDYLVKNITFTQRLVDVISAIPKIALGEGINESDFYSAVFNIGEEGTQLISYEDIHFMKNPKDELTRLGTFYLIAIGQGDGYNEGLFGPLPISNTDFTSILFSFCVEDPHAVDVRLKEHNLIILTYIIKKELEYAFSDRTAIQSLLEEVTSSITEVKDLTEELVSEIKIKLMKIVNKTIHEFVMSKKI
ncbi:MAG: response regulator [Candidatus Heimdallarchaeota archaeon]|nr:response regulator [Candidatus Heimdallarchaeota archaeon]MCK5048105.1 response regulator [Candidatus Heimdallarchaeota archaeon]